VLRRLYDRTIALADTPYALAALAVIAFVESSVFPIPPDVLMIPMMLARPNRAFLIAGVALAASVAGGMLGYYIGAVLFESVGRPVLEFYGKDVYFDDFATRYNAYGAWAVLIAGVTPFPYKVITIMSGTTGLSLPVFIVASIVARGVRFYALAVMLRLYGAPIRLFIERWFGLLSVAFVALLIGGFWLVRYL
jgi:membrane protein YqaA with SNARE-associated domain